MEHLAQLLVAIVIISLGMMMLDGARMRSKMTKAERRREDGKFDGAW